mgnify:CR=1 FL=1
MATASLNVITENCGDFLRDVCGDFSRFTPGKDSGRAWAGDGDGEIFTMKDRSATGDSSDGGKYCGWIRECVLGRDLKRIDLTDFAVGFSLDRLTSGWWRYGSIRECLESAQSDTRRAPTCQAKPPAGKVEQERIEGPDFCRIQESGVEKVHFIIRDLCMIMFGIMSRDLQEYLRRSGNLNQETAINYSESWDS